MDLNGVYYPVYESAFDDALAGRCPLTNEEVNQLAELTGISLWNLNNFSRQLQAQVAFDRPELSPILDGIRQDKENMKSIDYYQSRKETPERDTTR